MSRALPSNEVAFMNRPVAALLLALPVCLVVAVGCDPPPQAVTAAAAPPGPPLPPGSSPPTPPAAPAPPPVAAQPRPAAMPVESKAGFFAGGLDDLAAPARAPQSTNEAPTESSIETSLPPLEPGKERVKAGKGVGIKGRSLDEHEGIVVTPAKTFFSAKERIAFEIAVPQAYAFYIATADDIPTDFADFEAKVLLPNQIVLPQLPPGHFYVWDATKQELQVERPVK